MKILVTGCAGFIGYHLCAELLKNKNYDIVGIDNINNYYSKNLKYLRLNQIKKFKNFDFYKIDISNYYSLEKIFKNKKIDIIINLAAQAGVRYSLKHPREYISSNILGFYNILELSRVYNIKKIFYASSSSVYGEQKKFPLVESQKLNPKNIYSLTKKNNEDLAELYKNYYGLKLVGLRFFTVYGEWGRPDMLMMKYMLAKIKKKTFTLNNKGNHYRDFTYIKDVIEILKKMIFKKYDNDHEIFNICSNNPQSVKKILGKLDKIYGKPKIKHQKRLSIEVIKTHGSNKKVIKFLDFKKFTDINDGILRLVLWSKKYLNRIH